MFNWYLYQYPDGVEYFHNDTNTGMNSLTRSFLAILTDTRYFTYIYNLTIDNDTNTHTWILNCTNTDMDTESLYWNWYKY